MWHTGFVAPRHVGSSWTRDRTRVPCIGRILNHCATREVPPILGLNERSEVLGEEGLGTGPKPCPKRSPAPGHPGLESLGSCPERLCLQLSSQNKSGRSREPSSAVPSPSAAPGPSGFSPMGWDLAQGSYSHFFLSVQCHLDFLSQFPFSFTS